MAICKDRLLSWVMVFQPLRTGKWKNGSEQQWLNALWFGFFKYSSFSKEPDPQHSCPSLGARVAAAVLQDAVQKGSRHNHSCITQAVPNVPFLTAHSNGTDTADESHKQDIATKSALKKALQLFI